jgi:tRNA (uracil-5-)-methyltransferase
MIIARQAGRILAKKNGLPIFTTSFRNMASSISVPRSPPSPSHSLAPLKRLRQEGTIDGDLTEPIQPAESSNAAATEQSINAKKATKKAKSRSRKAPPIEAVLLHDLLSALGWEEMPVRSDQPTEAQNLGQKLWPKTAPAWKNSRNKQPQQETAASAEEARDWGFTEAEFTVIALTSHGDGIAVYPAAPEKPQWAIVIPFTLPGDVVKAKVTRHQHFHSFADPISIISSNPSTSTFPIATTRDDSLVGCKYFGSCAGCQYQFLPYEQQLALKRHVLVKAMRNFSDLPAEQVPEVKETIPSPKQYNYRTKITPHFDLPKTLQTGKKGRQAASDLEKEKARAKAVDGVAEEDAMNGAAEPEPELFTPIGFEGKCKPGILDIEVCPIATEAILAALPAARADVKKNIRTYKRGATLLLRDSLVPETSVNPTSSGKIEVVEGNAMDQEEGLNGSAPQVAIEKRKRGRNDELTLSTDVKLKQPEEHECISNHSYTVTEKVGDLIFQV